VVVPAYNASPWIAETLESVFAQTSPADEVIVVDDGSTDDTKAVLAPFAHRIRLIEQDNAGCGQAFNTGIGAASGQYVALCPADDLWERNKLEWQRETLARHPEVDVSFGGAEFFGTGTGPFARPAAAGVLDQERLLRAMIDEDVVPDPSVVLRRELHTRLGGFVSAIGEDYEFWMRAVLAGATFHFDPRLLVRLRMHGGNLSSNALAIWEMNLAVHRMAAPALGDQALARRVIARDLRRVGRCRLGLGRVAEGRAAYSESLHYQRTVSAALAAVVLRAPGARRAVARLNERRQPASAT
jgi:glycosyltransferase involved in cell wall biosynthesis